MTRRCTHVIDYCLGFLPLPFLVPPLPLALVGLAVEEEEEDSVCLNDRMGFRCGASSWVRSLMSRSACGVAVLGGVSGGLRVSPPNHSEVLLEVEEVLMDLSSCWTRAFSA